MSNLIETPYFLIVFLLALLAVFGIIGLAFLQEGIHEEKRMFDEADIYNDDLF